MVSKIRKEEEVLFDKNLNKLITLLARNPSHKFTQAELRKSARLSKLTVSKWLQELERLDFVKTERIGRNILYYVTIDNPIVKQMKILFNVSSLYKIAKEIAKVLECEVYLFGSVARGEDTEKSDIDLLIIGDKVPQSAVMAIIGPLEKEWGRKITFHIFTRMEWAQTARKDKAFYERVEKDRIRLA
ncbi:MAG TPA: nucleotidyltransferase domain-containing protein [Candidatus Nanoarchaeia archaeon]|nr:nucleotidyltransferase domain-containing protein [Candidatus Nanoarchaeia archaeon]